MKGEWGMSKNYNVPLLMDFYGGMLTEKQRDVLQLYYEEDRSLSEIGKETGITRQGVRDSIMRGEAVLRELEENLGFVSEFKKKREAADDICRLMNEIMAINDKFTYNSEIEIRAKQVVKLAKVLGDDLGEG